METVADILVTKGAQIFGVGPEATVLAAVDRMCRAHVGALVVLEGDALVGIFSERDVMTRVVLEQRDPASVRVGEVMSTSVVQVPPAMHAREAMAIMTDRRVRHLPVTEGACLVGLVSIGDVVRASLVERERTIDELERYCSGQYPGEEAAMAPQHILVVDDDESMRILLADVLGHTGYEVGCAVDGLDAIDKLRADVPEVVILDLLMPGRSGWDVLEFLEDDPVLSRVPVVVLTAYGDSEATLPHRPVLHKPLDLDVLRGVVRDVLDHRSS